MICSQADLYYFYLILTEITLHQSQPVVKCMSCSCLSVVFTPPSCLQFRRESKMTEPDKGEQPGRKFVLNVWWLSFFLISALTIGR